MNHHVKPMCDVCEWDVVALSSIVGMEPMDGRIFTMVIRSQQKFGKLSAYTEVYIRVEVSVREVSGFIK